MNKNNEIFENKQNMPIAFVTNFISQSWEQISTLTEQIEGLKINFKNAADVQKIIQDLIDTYLITVGQLEDYLEKNGKNSKVKKTSAIVDMSLKSETKENLEEDLNFVNEIADNEDIPDFNPEADTPFTDSEMSQVEQDSWMIDWTTEDTSVNNTEYQDFTPSAAEIANAKREVGGRGYYAAPIVASNENTVNTVDYDLLDDFPEPSLVPISAGEIDDMMGITAKIKECSDSQQ